MAELPSGPLFSIIVLVLAVLYLFPFLSLRCESKDCMQVSRLEIVDEFRSDFS